MIIETKSIVLAVGQGWGMVGAIFCVDSGLSRGKVVAL